MKQILLLMGMGLIILMPLSGARACSCAPMTIERSLEIIKDADLIFEGRVVMLEKKEQPAENFNYETVRAVSEDPLYSKVRLKIVDLYKGVADTKRLTAYIDTQTSCGTYFEISDRGLFVLNRHDDVWVQADICHTPLPEHLDALQAGKFKTASLKDK